MGLSGQGLPNSFLSVISPPRFTIMSPRVNSILKPFVALIVVSAVKLPPAPLLLDFCHPSIREMPSAVTPHLGSIRRRPLRIQSLAEPIESVQGSWADSRSAPFRANACALCRFSAFVQSGREPLEHDLR